MGEIKRNIAKQGKRHTISRTFWPKKEKEAIATWRLSLNRILCVLNVRSVSSCNRCWGADFPLQSEFGSGEPLVTPDPRHGAAEPRTTTPDAHPGNPNAETISLTASHGVSDLLTTAPQVPTGAVSIHVPGHETHHNATESIDDSRNPGRPVSPISASSASEWVLITAQTHDRLVDSTPNAPSA